MYISGTRFPGSVAHSAHRKVGKADQEDNISILWVLGMSNPWIQSVMVVYVLGA